MKEELDFWDVGRKHMRTSWWKGGVQVVRKGYAVLY